VNRRGLFATLALAAAGLAAPGKARADAPRAAKVVYHLADAERAAFVLGNVHNHLAGAGGPIALAVVVHGPALAAFRRDRSDPAVRSGTREAMAKGVKFHACAHTMSGMNLTLADLEPGFVVAPDGGVVLLADLQAAGWAYLRP
jgi:intracellular sulfur oxidation DsrE/DsrF family protein